MEARELEFSGVWEITPQIFPDSRGSFTEVFVREKILGATGFDFNVAQSNLSVSKQGTIRGIHFALPPGQAKFVQCLSGRIADVIVDIRKDSPTFGKYITIELDSSKRNAVLIPGHFGHAFQALCDDVMVMYQCDLPYSPKDERAINPFDPVVAIQWPLEHYLVSEKDAAAPSIADVAI